MFRGHPPSARNIRNTLAHFLESTIQLHTKSKYDHHQLLDRSATLSQRFYNHIILSREYHLGSPSNHWLAH
jgi:Zn-dependent oligopeptidase